MTPRDLPEEVRALLREIGRKDAKAKALEKLCASGGDDLSFAVAFLGDERIAAVARMLARNGTVRTLDLNWNACSEDGAAELARALERNTHLWALDLSVNRIGPVGAAALARALEQNSTLETLELVGNSIGPAGVEALAHALSGRNASLRALNLVGNNVAAAGVDALARALARKNRTLATLNLGFNELSAEDMGPLARALESNTGITTLIVSDNRLGPDGARALSRALKRNVTIAELDVGANRLGTPGALALARALEKNASITALDASTNEIGDDGVTALARALAHNTTVRKLILVGNGIAPRGAVALAGALERDNTTVQEVWLNKNNVGDAGAAALASALESNPVVFRLDLDGNQVDPAICARLGKLLERSQTAAMRATQLEEEVQGIQAELRARREELARSADSATHARVAQDAKALAQRFDEVAQARRELEERFSERVGHLGERHVRALEAMHETLRAQQRALVTVELAAEKSLDESFREVVRQDVEEVKSLVRQAQAELQPRETSARRRLRRLAAQLDTADTVVVVEFHESVDAELQRVLGKQRVLEEHFAPSLLDEVAVARFMLEHTIEAMPTVAREAASAQVRDQLAALETRQSESIAAMKAQVAEELRSSSSSSSSSAASEEAEELAARLEQLEETREELEAREALAERDRAAKAVRDAFFAKIAAAANLDAFARRLAALLAGFFLGPKIGVNAEAGRVLGVLEFGGKVLDRVPVVTGLLDYLAEAPAAALQRTVSRRSVLENLQTALTLSEAKRLVSALVRALTDCYALQLAQLATPAELAAQGGARARAWLAANRGVLSELAPSPAEVLAEFLVAKVADCATAVFGLGREAPRDTPADATLEELFLRAIHRMNPHALARRGDFVALAERAKRVLLDATVPFAPVVGAGGRDAPREFRQQRVVDVLVRPAVLVVLGDEPSTDWREFGVCVGTPAMAQARGLGVELGAAEAHFAGAPSRAAAALVGAAARAAADQRRLEAQARTLQAQAQRLRALEQQVEDQTKVIALLQAEKEEVVVELEEEVEVEQKKEGS